MPSAPFSAPPSNTQEKPLMTDPDAIRDPAAASPKANTQSRRPPSKILVDGGDPQETERIKGLLGFVDGQTTNRSLVAKNPEVARLVKSGQKLTEAQQS